MRVTVVVIFVFVALSTSLNLCATEVEQGEVVCCDLPRWSPDGQHIAFQADANDRCDIWLIHPDGTGLQRATTGDYGGLRPQWSSDSAQLRYLSVRGAGKQLWSRDISTGVETRVLPGSMSEYAVSHSGLEVIVPYSADDTNGLIIVSSTTGTQLRWLLASRRGASDPTWSPDDQEAAFTKDGDIWARSTVDRSNLRRLTSLSEVMLGAPDWGSGGLIVFHRESSLCNVRPDGTLLATLFADPSGWPRNPSWSPGADRVAFSRMLDDTQDIWLINTDGSGLAQLTNLKPVFGQ